MKDVISACVFVVKTPAGVFDKGIDTASRTEREKGSFLQIYILHLTWKPSLFLGLSFIFLLRNTPVMQSQLTVLSGNFHTQGKKFWALWPNGNLSPGVCIAQGGCGAKTW